MARITHRDKEISRRLRRYYNKTDLRFFEKCAKDLGRVGLVERRTVDRINRILKFSGLMLKKDGR